MGRAMNLVAHAYGLFLRQERRRRSFHSLHPREADHQIAQVLMGYMAIFAAVVFAVYGPFIMLAGDLGDAPLGHLLDFVGYTLVSAPVATMAYLIGWDIVTPRSQGRRRGQRRASEHGYLMPPVETRYDYPPFVRITTVSWALALLVAVVLISNDIW